jgi:hypothetical protein
VVYSRDVTLFIWSSGLRQKLFVVEWFCCSSSFGRIIELQHWVLWAGLAAAGVCANAQPAPVASVRHHDPRLAKLKAFFDRYDSPAARLAEHFLKAADRYGLDWRLLPSISIVETGGGKTAVNNNLLGWNSARMGFATARESIYFVASRLAESKLYRGKNLDGLLARYNARRQWAELVKAVMRRADPGEPLRARRAVAADAIREASLRDISRLELRPSR